MAKLHESVLKDLAVRDAVLEWHTKVSGAAFNFERRWTKLALARLDSDLAMRLQMQQGNYDAACMFGSPCDVEKHGSSMCRGWQTAVKAMEDSNVPDDAYVLGADPASGVKVAIGTQRPAAERVVELLGLDVIWITPDEVAVLVATTEAGKAIGGVKAQWPGAEVTRYESEGT